MQRLPQVGAGQRSYIGRLVEGIAERLFAHERDDQVLELASEGIDDEEALGGDAALSGVDESAGDAGFRGEFDVRILEYQVRVAPAQFEHGLLDLRPRRRGHRLPGAHTSRERDRPHERFFDQPRRRLVVHDQRPEEVRGESRFPEQLFNGQGTARYGHESWSGEAQHLPEWEVPGHDGEHHTEWLVRDVRAGPGPWSVDHAVCELIGSVVRVVVTYPGTFLGLTPALGDRFPHLLGH